MASEAAESSRLEPPRSRLRGGAPLSRLLAEAGPLLVLLLSALALHGSGLLGGPVFWERDTTLFYYPLTDWFAEQLRAGRLPLWIPTLFAGYPIQADGEVGPLYLPNLLLLPFLPFDRAFVALRLLHTLVAAVLAYALFRTLGVGRLGAVVAGLVFAFGSFLVAQLQHDNMVRSAIWLPGQILALELAFRRRGWARQRWLVATGLLVGLACLGVHVQAVAMSLMALGLYVVYRLAAGPFDGSRLERLVLLIWAPGLVTALGVALAAAQWLPLFELGRTSFRGPGLLYHLAVTYTLHLVNLPSLLFPYFFRSADGAWWSLWVPWETLPYVGIAPLGLALLGLVAARCRPVWYFAALSMLGLWIALSYSAPLLNLHEVLWRLPGLSSLRAPGRFTFLFILGVAGLAAYGLDSLTRHRHALSVPFSRPVPSSTDLPPHHHGRGHFALLPIGLLSLGLALGLSVAFGLLTQRLLANPGWGQQAAEVRYLSLPHQNPDLQPYQVYEGLLHSLSLGNPKTLLSLALLAVVGALLLLAWRRPTRARGVAVTLVGLTAVDLLAFALDYHPSAPLSELNRLPPVVDYLARSQDGERVFVEPVLGRLEPNRLTLGRVWELNGYSSLQSQRHWEYASSVDRQDNMLLDIWNGRYYVVPASRTDVKVVVGTAYRPYELLMSGGAGNPSGRERFRLEPFPSGEVRVLAALANALSVPQGETVAELTLVGMDGRRLTYPLRAGLEVSEHAIDRPDVAPIAAHGRAQVVDGLPDQAPNGLKFTSNIYYASFRVDPPLQVHEVELRYLWPEGYLRLWGLGLVQPGTELVRSLFADDKAKYEHPALYRDDEAVVYRNSAAFPRAFVVPDALVRPSRTAETAIARMALQPFDPRRQAILEEGPFDDLPVAAVQLADSGSAAVPPAAAVTDLSSDHLLVRASGPGVLVLNDAYHRGWRAYLGGREVPVYLANYVGRAVALPPGDHTVEFVFDPLSWRLGRAISLAALVFALLVLSSRWWARERVLTH